MSKVDKDLESQESFQNKPYFFPGQFFDIDVSGEFNSESNPIEEVHKVEWDAFIYFSRGVIPKIRNGRIDYKNLIFEQHLIAFMEKEGNLKVTFLNHFEMMLTLYGNSLDDDMKDLMRGWLNYHIDLLNNPDKEYFIQNSYDIFEKLNSNQTKAYFVHFHILSGMIKPDKYDQGIPVIEQMKYRELGDAKSYQEYRNIILDIISPRRVKECCDELISRNDIDSKIIDFAKTTLMNSIRNSTR